RDAPPLQILGEKNILCFVRKTLRFQREVSRAKASSLAELVKYRLQLKFNDDRLQNIDKVEYTPHLATISEKPQPLISHCYEKPECSLGMAL
ncbi:MAG: hypothetical protein WBC69_14170, partial [Geitlerinemataceae cyanobacterium]